MRRLERREQIRILLRVLLHVRLEKLYFTQGKISRGCRDLHTIHGYAHSFQRLRRILQKSTRTRNKLHSRKSISDQRKSEDKKPPHTRRRHDAWRTHRTRSRACGSMHRRHSKQGNRRSVQNPKRN